MYHVVVIFLTLVLRVAPQDIYAGGQNSYGNLGLGDYLTHIVPTKLDPPSGGGVWESFTCGGKYAAAISSLGTLYTTGQNGWGELGTPTTTVDRENMVPVDYVGTPPRWVSVACGHQHTLAITSTGTMEAVGSNTYGQLGVGDNTDRDAFGSVPDPTSGIWSSVAGGYFQSVALTDAGVMYTWGRNQYGDLGQNTVINTNVPVAVSPPSGGGVWSSVNAGQYFTAAITSGGDLYVTGRNNYGQLGVGATPTTSKVFLSVGAPSGGGLWSVVSCGQFHLLAVSSTGQLYSWGRNSYGQLGIAALPSTKNVPTLLPDPPSGTWKSCGCGYVHSIAITSENVAYGCGDNFYGQVCDGTYSQRNSMTLIAGVNTARAVGGFGHTYFGPGGCTCGEDERHIHLRSGNFHPSDRSGWTCDPPAAPSSNHIRCTKCKC